MGGSPSRYVLLSLFFLLWAQWAGGEVQPAGGGVQWAGGCPTPVSGRPAAPLPGESHPRARAAKSCGHWADGPPARSGSSRRPGGGPGRSDGLFAAAQILGQPGIGGRARGLSACELEQGGGQEDGFVLAPEAGVLAEVMGQSGEGEGLGLGSRVWAWERTLPPSGPRGRGRRGASGCRAVHGSLPPFPGVDPGLERRGREDRPQVGHSSGAFCGRERAEASCGSASEEFSVMGSDRPLHWSVGRLE